MLSWFNNICFFKCNLYRYGTVQFLCKGGEGMEAAAEVLARDFGLATIRLVILSSKIFADDVLERNT